MRVMVEPNNAVSLGRLAIVPFAPLQWILVWLSLRRPVLSKKPVMRMIIAFFIGASFLAIDWTQLSLYSSIAQEWRPLEDKFVLSLVIIQSFVTIFLTFRILRVRQKNSRT